MLFQNIKNSHKIEVMSFEEKAKNGSTEVFCQGATCAYYHGHQCDVVSVTKFPIGTTCLVRKLLNFYLQIELHSVMNLN